MSTVGYNNNNNNKNMLKITQHSDDRLFRLNLFGLSMHGPLHLFAQRVSRALSDLEPDENIQNYDNHHRDKEEQQ